MKKAKVFPLRSGKLDRITPHKIALTTLREIATNDPTIIALAADLLAGIGMDSLKDAFGYGSATDRNVRLFRLPLAENLMFRLTEGLVSQRYFPVIGILEPLLSIVMLELQSLAVAANHYDTGALILSSSPGRSSDAGPSMRSIAVVQMLESIPGVSVVDPRDLKEVDLTVRKALMIRRGITVLRLPEMLPQNWLEKSDNDLIYSWPLDHKRIGINAVLVTSGWIFCVAQRFIQEKYSDRGPVIVGISRREDLRRLPLDRLKEIFEGRHVGTLSDTNRDWLHQVVSTVLCESRVTVASLTPLGASGIDAPKFRFCAEQVGVEVDKLVGKIGSVNPFCTLSQIRT